MKKIISILLCVILIFSAVGCGDPETSIPSHNSVEEYKAEFYADMSKNEIVSTEILIRISKYFKCGIDDIMDIVEA